AADVELRVAFLVGQVDLAGRRITVESRGGIDACTGIAADDDLSIPARGTDQLSAFALVVVPTQAPVAGALGTFALLAPVSHHRVRSRCGAILALGAAATKADAAPSVRIPAVLTVFTLDVADVWSWNTPKPSSAPWNPASALAASPASPCATPSAAAAWYPWKPRSWTCAGSSTSSGTAASSRLR